MPAQITSLFPKAAEQFRQQWRLDLVQQGIDFDESCVDSSSDEALCDTYKLAWARRREQEILMSQLTLSYDREVWSSKFNEQLIYLFTYQGVEEDLATKIVDEEIIGHSLH